MKLISQIGSCMRVKGIGFSVFFTLAMGGVFAIASVFDAISQNKEDYSNEQFAHLLRLDEPDDKWKAGTIAPDFSLPSIDDQKPISLSSFRGRPLVLILSSFSCDRFCSHLPGLNRIHDSYQDVAGFLFVNIREAGHQVMRFESMVDLDKSPQDIPPADRRDRIGRAMKHSRFTLPSVLDADSKVDKAYSAFPLRLLVLNAQGKVTLDLGNGITHRWELTELEEHLQSLSQSYP